MFYNFSYIHYLKETASFDVTFSFRVTKETIDTAAGVREGNFTKTCIHILK